MGSKWGGVWATPSPTSSRMFVVPKNKFGHSPSKIISHPDFWSQGVRLFTKLGL